MRLFCLVFMAVFFLGNGLAQAASARTAIIAQYLNDFSAFPPGSKVDIAIKNVLQRVPDDVFKTIMDRRRPVIFTDFYDSGTARFASSQEVIFGPADPPCCQEGFTIIKLGPGLDQAPDPSAIEAIVAHELAHRILDHIRKGYINCDAERQANRLIKKWGFGAEYKTASHLFGHKKTDPASCQEQAKHKG